MEDARAGVSAGAQNPDSFASQNLIGVLKTLQICPVVLDLLNMMLIGSKAFFPYVSS